MAKVADIKLKWKRSVSTDALKVKLSVNIDGAVTETELPVETEEFAIVVSANTSFGFSIVTIDTEGLVSTALTFSATLGDLENPQPATDAGFDIVAIRDV